MTRSAADILVDALALPAEARAAIATRPIDSLDEAVYQDAATAWVTEIARRIDEIEGGTIQLVPWADARRRLAGQ